MKTANWALFFGLLLTTLSIQHLNASSYDYRATAFESGQWTLTEAPGQTQWDGKILNFTLEPGQTATLDNAFSLYGYPQSVTLRVRTPAAGPQVRMVMNSHFHYYEKTLGTLDGSGEQTFTSALGDMQEWRHFGMKEGQVVYPLRLYQIKLDAGESAAAGSVEFLDVRIITENEPRDTVVVVPDGRLDEAGNGIFDVTVTSIESAPLAGTLTYEALDYDGAVRDQQQFELTLPAAGVAHRLTVQSPMRDMLYLEGQFTFRAEAGDALTTCSRTIVHPVDQPAESALDPASPIGVGLYFYRYPNTEEGMRQMAEAARLARQAGVKWTREEFGWATIEKERGQYQWDFYDRVLQTAHEYGISVYGLIDYWSPWTTPYSAAGLSDYAHYARVLAHRYADRVRHWEVYNEPNIAFWEGPREVYPLLLKQTYQTIKDEDPGLMVLGCSTAGVDMTFIEMVNKAEAPYDILTIHPYREHFDEEQFIADLRAAEKVAGGRPVWITEMGWATELQLPGHKGYGFSGRGEKEQAQLLARTYLSALGSGAVENISWYDFREDGIDPHFFEYHLGIVRHDFRPKPAYRALATVGRALEGRRFSRRLEWGAGILAFLFEGAGQPLIAVWSPREPRMLALETSTAELETTSIMGAKSRIAATGDRCELSLKANEPVFLTGFEQPPAIAAPR